MSLQSFLPFGSQAFAFEPPAAPDTVFVTSDYTLSSGDSLTVEGSLGIKVLVRQGAEIDVTLDGTVNVASDSGKAAGLITTASTHGYANIEVNSDFNVTATGEGDMAAGFVLQGENDSLTSSGAIDVVSVHGDAIGAVMAGDQDFDNFGSLTVQSAGMAFGIVGSVQDFAVNYGTLSVTGRVAVGFLSQPGSDPEFINLGDLSVRAIKGTEPAGQPPVALGAAVVDGGFGNAGTISAYAHGQAVGVELLNAVGASNGVGGLIQAHASGAHALAVGVLLGSTDSSGPSGPTPAIPPDFVNQGVVRADIAISSFIPGAEGADFGGGSLVQNFGNLIGDVLLASGDDTLINGNSIQGGLIKGDVHMGGDDDVFTSQHGRLLGAVYGEGGDDFLTGSKQGDILTGDGAGGEPAGDDRLVGLRGGDIITGGGGDDTLIGGRGADQMRGGDGADVFVYVRTADSHSGQEDQIQDLDSSDLIDLHRIDADTTTAGSDDAFHIVSSFSGAAGELVVSFDSLSGDSTISGDTDGDGTADLVITVFGDASSFTNFVL